MPDDHSPTVRAVSPRVPARPGPRRAERLVTWVVLMLGMALGLVVAGCERKQEYPQGTPDEVIASAVEMVKRGETSRLTGLVYADSPEMRVVLDRLGRLLENMQGLSAAARERFPEEFAKMRAEAEAAAASGKSTTLLGTLMSQAGRGRRGNANPDQARQLINQLFADPYGWLEVNAKRLSTVNADDTTAYVLLDGQPAIPIIGLPMRREKDRWYVALPTGVPPINQFWPRSREQWSILASIIKVVDNAVAETTNDVRAGAVSDMTGLIDKISDKALFPAGIAFVAFGKEIDIRARVDRRAAQFGKRRRDWVSERRKQGPAGGAGVSPALIEVIDDLAPVRIEADIRRQKRPAFEEMTTPRFEEVVREWLSAEGLSVPFDGDLASPTVDQAVERWKAAGGRKKK